MPKAVKTNQLFERFVVCGLSPELLCTVAGEPGFLGTNFRYKASLSDQLPHTNGDNSNVPPQLPACCLPSGVDIVLKADVSPDDRHPRTYTVVLTEGDGTKLFASCLAFYDDVPPELAAKHEDLCGAQSLKAICLLSHKPYLTTCEKTLRRLYQLTFFQASATPIPDLIHYLLQLPCPASTGTKVCFTLEGQVFVTDPPGPMGPPPDELPLRPLVEALRADQLATLFVAVLLERRVLLRSQQYWLLSAVAEGLVELLHPFKFQHVYIPIMPYNLVDYLEAPTPFLMGLHSSVELDSRSLEGILVLDLDRQVVRNDESLEGPRTHPAVVQLEKRLALLQQPSIMDADVVAQRPDAWTALARTLMGQPWGPSHDCYLRRVFLEAMLGVVQGYHSHVAPLASPRGGQRGGTSGGSGRFDAKGFVKEVAAKDRSCHPLLSQAVQGISFFSFVEEHGSGVDPYEWYARALPYMSPCQAPEDVMALDSCREPVSIAPPRRGLLRPPAACMHRCFPALIYTEEDSGVLRVRRKTGGKKQRRLSRVSATKRRAISDLMGAGDLRRKSPSVDDVAPRMRSVEWGGSNLHLQLLANSSTASGGSLSTISGSSSSATNDYLAEADLVRRQTSALLGLLAHDGSEKGGEGGEGDMEALEAELAKDLLHVQTGGNGWFLVSRLKEELSGGSTAAAAGLQHAQQQQQAQQGQQQEASPASSGPLAAVSNELRERCVSRRSFKALTCMFDSMVTAAHLQDDMRVIHSVLQLAARIYRRPAHCLPQRLLAQLRTNPLWYQEQLWAGLFGFAVSCQYLGAAEHLDLQQVVTHQLLEFCHHLTGLGITGHSAWQLIQRLAGLHLQHAPLDPATMTGIRAHLLRLEGPALQQLALAFGPEAAAEVSGLLAPPPDVCRQPLGRLGRSPDQGSRATRATGSLSPRATGLSALPDLPSYRATGDSTVGLAPIKQAAMLAAAGAASRRSITSRSHMCDQPLVCPVYHQEQPHKGAISGLDACGSMAVSASLDDSIRVYDAREGYLRQYACLPLRPNRAVRCTVRVFNQGQRAAVANADGFNVWVLDIASSSPAIELQGCKRAVAHLAASSCGTLLAAAGGEQVVRIWDVRRPEKCILKVHVGGAEQGQGQAEQGSSGASALHYSSEEQLLAVASKSDCCVRVYDIRQASQPLSTCRGHQDWVTGIMMLPPPGSSGQGSTRLVTSSLDWTARCWQMEQQEATCDGAFVGHASGVTCLQLLDINSQQRLVTGTQDGCVAVWSLPPPSSRPVSAPAATSASAASTSPPTTAVLACNHMLPSMGAPVRLLAEGNEDWLLAGAGNSSCRLYDAASLMSAAGEPALVAAQQQRGRAGCMAWDAAALQLYAGGVDGSIGIWDCSGSE